MSAILTGLHFVLYDFAVMKPPPPTIKLAARDPNPAILKDATPAVTDVQFVQRTFILRKIWHYPGAFWTAFYEEDGSCTIEWPSGKYVGCTCPTCKLGWTKPGEILPNP